MRLESILLKESRTDSDANEVQKHLHLQGVNVGEYLTDNYALWLNFKTTNGNALHGTGRWIGSAGEESLYGLRRK